MATGIIRFHLTGIPEMVRSFTVTGAGGLPEKAAAVERLGQTISGVLWETYGQPHVEMHRGEAGAK